MKGENDMAKFQISGGNSGSIYVAEPGGVITIINFNSELNKFKQEVGQLLLEAD